MAAVLRDAPPPPRQFRPELDAELERLVLRALSKEAADRPASARAFADELARWATAGPAVPASSEETTALTMRPAVMPPPPRQRWPSEARMVGWAFGAALMAGSGVLMALVQFETLSSERWDGGEYISLSFFSVIGSLLMMFLGLTIWAVAEWGNGLEGLRWAASTGYVGAVQRAAANGVPLDDPDDLGETALMRAAAGGHIEAVEVLLLHGAGADQRNSFGQTAREIAEANKHGDVVALLRKYEGRREPPPPRPAPAPPMRARRWLTASVLAGALAGVAWIYLLRLGPPDRPPPEWLIAPMLAVPLLIAYLVGLPVGSASYFPMLRR
jgi:hypothetical protein